MNLADLTRTILVLLYGTLAVWAVVAAFRRTDTSHKVLSWAVAAVAVTWLGFYVWSELAAPFEMSFAVQLSRIVQIPGIGLAVMVLLITRNHEHATVTRLRRIANGD